MSWLRQDAKAMLHAASNIHEMMLWLFFLQCSANFNRVAASCTVPDSSMVPFQNGIKAFIKSHLIARTAMFLPSFFNQHISMKKFKKHSKCSPELLYGFDKTEKYICSIGCRLWNEWQITDKARWQEKYGLVKLPTAVRSIKSQSLKIRAFYCFPWQDTLSCCSNNDCMREYLVPMANNGRFH